MVQSCPFSVTSTVARQLSSSHRSLRGSGTSFQLSSILGRARVRVRVRVTVRVRVRVRVDMNPNLSLALSLPLPLPLALPVALERSLPG